MTPDDSEPPQKVPARLDPPEVRELIGHLEKNARDIESHRKLGFLYWRMGRATEALIEFRKIHQIDPKNREAPFALAALSVIRNQHFKAFEYLFEIAYRELPRGSHDEPFDFSRLRFTSRHLPAPFDDVDWIALFRDCEQRVRLDHAAVERSRKQGEVSLQQRCYDKAIRLFTMLTFLQPRDPLIRLYRGQALTARRRDREAEAEYAEAILLQPRDKEAYKALGKLRARNGDDAKARAAFEQVLKIDPADPDARLWMEKTG